MTTRKQALEKAAGMLTKAESNALGDQAVSKYLTLGQLWMSLAHEIGSPETITANVA
jgi:hypothetical protein